MSFIKRFFERKSFRTAIEKASSISSRLIISTKEGYLIRNGEFRNEDALRMISIAIDALLNYIDYDNFDGRIIIPIYDKSIIVGYDQGIIFILPLKDVKTDKIRLSQIMNIVGESLL